MTRLFYATVDSVNLKHYSDEQVRAWAPEIPDPEVWHLRMSGRCTLVAEENAQVLAFAELERNGHLDMFYCRHDAVGRRVARRLYQAVETKAQGAGLTRIFTEASITARPFFEHHGFSVLRQQTVAPRGIRMTNFPMEKRLSATLA
ncbi:MAG: GNAT family N-acetyltransferase [Candidatus Binataceae bacterium]